MNILLKYVEQFSANLLKLVLSRIKVINSTCMFYYKRLEVARETSKTDRDGKLCTWTRDTMVNESDYHVTVWGKP